MPNVALFKQKLEEYDMGEPTLYLSQEDIL